MDAIQFAIALLVGYLLGSIPFGVIVTQLGGTEDIRTIGSGNIGATNVLRTGRKALAAATLLGDLLKGTLAVLIARRLGGRDPAVVAAFAAVIGHVFPVWLHFKGGKGVATYVGVLLAMSWSVATAFAVIWVAVAAVTRYSSFAGLVGTAIAPPLLWWRGGQREAAVLALLTALVWFMHRENIMRLMRGTEPKLGSESTAAPGD